MAVFEYPAVHPSVCRISPCESGFHPRAPSPSRTKDAIEDGSSFADTLARFPQVFSPVYINMVNAGESSGTLEIVLERLS